MNNILMVFGGNSVEHEISIITSLQLKNKYNGKYNFILCYLKDGCFYYVNENVKINDFSNIKNIKKFKKIYFKPNKNYFYIGLKKVNFESVLITAHGMNCEDGTLYSFFKTLNLDVISENIYSGVIGQDKILSKKLTSVKSLPFFKIDHYTYCYNLKDILNYVEKIEFPIIIKPSKLGSSVGVHKVYNVEDLIDKIETLLNMCDSILIEKLIENFEEYNIALLVYNNNYIVSEIEKVSTNKVLTYDDKYINDEKSMLGQKRQIPAIINKKLKNEIISNAKTIYSDLSSKGIVRIDYLYDVDNKILYFNEINNIPGSLATYLFEHIGISINDLIDMMIDEGLKNLQKEKAIITSYEKNILNEKSLNNVKLFK